MIAAPGASSSSSCPQRCPLRWRSACAPVPSGRRRLGGPGDGARRAGKGGGGQAASAAPVLVAAPGRARGRGRRPAPTTTTTPTTTIVARVASVSSSSSAGDGDDPLATKLATAEEAAAAAAAAAAPSDATPAVTPPQAKEAAPPPTPTRALDALTRSRWYRWYLERLERRPTLTKAVTALCGFVIGDLIAQSLSLSPPSSSGGGAAAAGFSPPFFFWLAHVDWARTARMGAFGLLVDGPVGGAYYAWLDRAVFPDDPLSTRAVLAKTLLDQTVYASLGTALFFAFMRLLETGGDVSAVGPTLALKFFPTLAANWLVWPVAHLINFRFVPPPLRVAYNQVVAVGWLTWLSILAHGRAAAVVATGGGGGGAPAGASAAVAALAHKAAAGSVAVSGGGAGPGGGVGGWLHSLLQSLPHL